ncbi:hypothetical protein PALB_21270 [Pseudoalteromonas luteoviolacea B = ATCC 29581]|nr:hypothetical protein PALB_21270 [Pseudoalteromonas luteoviolacea B = ATCC 29581]
MTMNRHGKNVGSYITLFAALLTGSTAFSSYASVTWQGKIQVSTFERNEWKSWLNRGWSNNRFDAQIDSVVISRAWADVRVDLAQAWSLHSSMQYVPDPDDSLGFTEAYLKYNPLSNSPYQWQVKLGGFYPAMSLENPSVGWSSPYTYSFSGINAWLGEEIRTFGTEIEWSRLGKRLRSPHDFSVHVGLFKGNDPAGSMLAWRGLASHDRQSMFNESIYFNPVKALYERPLRFQAPFVAPFTEVDGRFGYYTGVHWDYQKRQQLRVYWYDNHGDPSAINFSTGQYAWDTRFLSVAWLYKLDKQTRIIAQWLDGKTSMGPRRGVDNNFSSWYALISHQMDAHRISARIERSWVVDHDDWAFDPNASENKALTLAYRFNLNEHWQTGIEWLRQDSHVVSRAAAGLAMDREESQWRYVLEYQF